MIETQNYLHRTSIAPMMDHTDRHFRYLMRLLSKHVFLYTEMITTGALVHGKQMQLLRYHELEHPIGVQFGGSDPEDLVCCAKIADDFGYDEINLNIGCPSNRVQNGHFGACLMASPEIVAECVAMMSDAVTIPVTVKTRTGIDNKNSYDDLHQFIDVISKAGCKHFIIHARNAILNGLSPKENRTIPPLQYKIVHNIKQDFPDLDIIINGGITTIEQIKHHLEFVDGVMIGRTAYQNPYLLAEIDNEIFNANTLKPSRHDVVKNYIPYIERQCAEGIYLKHMSKHLVGLFQGQPGARSYRRILCENTRFPDSGIDSIKKAVSKVLS